MQVIVYYPTDSAVGREVEAVTRTVVGDAAMRVFHDVREIALRFALSGAKDKAAVIVIDRRTDLGWLGKSRPLLSGVKFILVFAERDEAMLRQAFHLSPSYIASAPGDFADVAAVLAKLQTLFGEL